MKKLLLFAAVICGFAFNAQTKVDLAPYGLNASLSIPAEYGEAKVDSNVYSTMKTWSIKAGKKFKMKIKEKNKKAGVTPEAVIAATKKEIEGKKDGKVEFVKFAVDEKDALIFESKLVEANTNNFSMVYLFVKGDKSYEVTSGIAVFTEQDCKAMLAAAKAIVWK